MESAANTQPASQLLDCSIVADEGRGRFVWAELWAVWRGIVQVFSTVLTFHGAVAGRKLTQNKPGRHLRYGMHSVSFT